MEAMFTNFHQHYVMVTVYIKAQKWM